MYESIKDRILEARRVCVFTGAGISAESGIPTFRDAGGLWENYKIEDLVTPEAFARNPVAVWRWHIWLQGLSFNAEPNAGHRALAAMDDFFPDYLLITQNIDDLHERGGTKRLVKIHGDVMEIKCLEKGHLTRVESALDQDSVTLDNLPVCPKCWGRARPNVVWFGEMLPHEALMSATSFAEKCDLLLIVGTSGVVSGGYGFTELAKFAGAYIVEVNPLPSNLTHLADASIREPAALALPKLFPGENP
jgi:NAD-dependent deacetylase